MNIQSGSAENPIGKIVSSSEQIVSLHTTDSLDKKNVLSHHEDINKKIIAPTKRKHTQHIKEEEQQNKKIKLEPEQQRNLHMIETNSINRIIQKEKFKVHPGINDCISS